MTASASATLACCAKPIAPTSGTIAYRCPSEPENVYVAKGGVFEETAGRKCLCNCLLADIGLQQVQRDGSVEPGMVTSGDDLDVVLRFLAANEESYSAATAVKTLMSQLPARDASTPAAAPHTQAAREQARVQSS